MESLSMSRIKSAMVVYEFERALGRFVRERSIEVNSTPAAIEILKRKPEQTEQNSSEVTRQIVENSYLGEILSLAISAAKGSANTTEAITSGPAQAPRPASSTPASGVIPASISSDSITFMR
jgi:hypothetical protein